MKKSLRWIIAILCLSVTATVCASCGGMQAEKTELEAPIVASAVYTGETITANDVQNVSADPRIYRFTGKGSRRGAY